jgi:hypothetical protein
MQAGERWELSSRTRILFGTRHAAREIENSLEPLARVLAGELELVTGIRPGVVESKAGVEIRKADIVLAFEDLQREFAETEAEETQSYHLQVSGGVLIRSRYTKGVAYGTATLLQALREEGGRFGLPSMEIEDGPAAEYRAVMLDVARQVHSVGVIKDVIRMARLYKVRYVQLHLTDDQHFTFPFEPITANIENNFSYTRKELEELVAYADARGVTLIPELDLPGHSSRLKASGYLDPGKTDADVAAPENHAKIVAIIDDMLKVFVSAPYFHIGGDESAAGGALVPFLQRVNKHLCGTPPGGKRRMLVWEGFHGAPLAKLPAEGEDRIVVMSWESSYNSPWDLLEAGYELINASWKPTYVVGGGTVVHPGSSGGRKFRPEDLYRWSKDLFMHWEPGRPVYEDRGPEDDDRGDHQWSAVLIGKEEQVVGGQLLFWEQKEKTVINDLRSRLPAMAERLWNPEKGDDWEVFSGRAGRIAERVMTIVQPVEILPGLPDRHEPLMDLYVPYDGGSLPVTLRNRTKLEGVIRFEKGGFSNTLTWIDFPDTPSPTEESAAYAEGLLGEGGFSIRARLFREDGTAVDGEAWQFYNNWPDRVVVTEYEIDRERGAVVPDLAGLPRERLLRRYQMPMLRGPLRNVEFVGQLQESILTPPGTGVYTVSMKTQSGHASLFLDLNRDGVWDVGEKVIADTPNTEEPQSTEVEMKAGESYRLRVDHKSGMPRPVVLVYIEGPETDGRKEISPYLALPE